MENVTTNAKFKQLHQYEFESNCATTYDNKKGKKNSLISSFVFAG